MLKPMSNFLFITKIWVFRKFKKLDEKTKEKQRNDVTDIFTHVDMESISLISQM